MHVGKCKQKGTVIYLVFLNKAEIQVKHILCTKWNVSIEMEQDFFHCFSDKVSWHYKIPSSLWQKNCILPKPVYYLNMMRYNFIFTIYKLYSIIISCHSILWERSVSSLWLTTESQYKFTWEATCPEPQTLRLWERHSDPSMLSQAVILQQQWACVKWQQIILRIWAVTVRCHLRIFFS